MLMEWRRGVFGARFRVQLLLVFLLMAIAPSMLILLVGSDLIRQTVDRWFNVDVERMLVSSQSLGAALDASALEASRVHARLLAREIEARGLLAETEQGRLRRAIEARARERELDLVNVYASGRRGRGGDGPAPAAHVGPRLGRGAGRGGPRRPRGRGVDGVRGGPPRPGGGAGPWRRREPRGRRRGLDASCRRRWHRRSARCATATRSSARRRPTGSRSSPSTARSTSSRRC